MLFLCKNFVFSLEYADKKSVLQFKFPVLQLKIQVMFFLLKVIFVKSIRCFVLEFSCLMCMKVKYVNQRRLKTIGVIL